MLTRFLRLAAAAAILAVLGVALLLVAFSLERRGETTLPAPTGPLPVGRVIERWSDPATSDTLAPVAGAHRELLVWIWYPAAPSRSTPADDYVPAPMREAIGPPRGPMSLVTRDVAKIRAHSIGGAALSTQARSYPVVVMRAGASAGVAGYSSLAEDLASHGYVVVGFDAPYRTGAVAFPDGRVARRTAENNPERCAEQPVAQQDGCMAPLLAAWVADMRFVLDRLEQLNRADAARRFTGRLDMTRVGAFGHSLGGATTAQFCHDDPRCKAGIDIDGQPFGSVVQSGLRQPFMFLSSDHGKADDPVSRRIDANIQSIYDRLPPDTRHRFFIRGANHFLFSDDGAVLKSRILLRILRTVGAVGIDGRRQLAVTTYAVHTFFDHYLKGPSGAPLAIVSPVYPEIQ